MEEEPPTPIFQLAMEHLPPAAVHNRPSSARPKFSFSAQKLSTCLVDLYLTSLWGERNNKSKLQGISHPFLYTMFPGQDTISPRISKSQERERGREDEKLRGRAIELTGRVAVLLSSSKAPPILYSEGKHHLYSIHGWRTGWQLERECSAK